jgi:hypothetical protein
MGSGAGKAVAAAVVNCALGPLKPPSLSSVVSHTSYEVEGLKSHTRYFLSGPRYTLRSHTYFTHQRRLQLRLHWARQEKAFGRQH